MNLLHSDENNYSTTNERFAITNVICKSLILWYFLLNGLTVLAGPVAGRPRVMLGREGEV